MEPSISSKEAVSALRGTEIPGGKWLSVYVPDGNASRIVPQMGRYYHWKEERTLEETPKRSGASTPSIWLRLLRRGALVRREARTACHRA